jgi:hypothetical protein
MFVNHQPVKLSLSLDGAFLYGNISNPSTSKSPSYH